MNPALGALHQVMERTNLLKRTIIILTGKYQEMNITGHSMKSIIMVMLTSTMERLEAYSQDINISVIRVFNLP